MNYYMNEVLLKCQFLSARCRIMMLLLFSRCVPTWDLKHPCGKPCKCVGFSAGLFCCFERGRKAESFSLIHKAAGKKTTSHNMSDGQTTDPQLSKHIQMQTSVATQNFWRGKDIVDLTFTIEIWNHNIIMTAAVVHRTINFATISTL